MSPIPDIQYGADVGHPAWLVVDYDASRLEGLADVTSRCSELSDLVAEHAGPFNSLAMTVFSYAARSQLARDFSAAARLLARTGTMTVRLSEPRLAASVRRELAQHFTHVQAAGKATLLCHGPRADFGATLADDTETFSYFDPVAKRELRFMTRPGLFSVGALDLGTRLLLDVLAEEHDLQAVPTLLDIGCGYGAVGCVTAARGAR
jgi:16S rRNA G1207 methylase RsmC